MSETLTKARPAPDVAPGFSPASADLKVGATTQPAALRGGDATQVILKSVLRGLAKEWIAQGKVVAGPVQTKPGLVLYAPLASVDDIVWEGFVRPANSAKEFVFPRHESLCRYRMEAPALPVEGSFGASRMDCHRSIGSAQQPMRVGG